VLPSVHQRTLCWAYGPLLRAWCRANPCAEFANREELYRFVLERAGLDGPIDFLEFGVYQGASIRWWVENNRHPESTFVGFDSFEGLPEAWGPIPKGTFTAHGQIPEIPDPRCRFIKGLFQETLPSWIVGRDFSHRTVLHLDADLYSSTLVVLTQLLPKLKTSDVVMFDDFRDCLNEYRAFADATAAYSRRFQVLGHARDWGKVALAVID
jgi:O-methyltransferase